MPRRDLSLPLAIIATGIVLIGLLLLDWPGGSMSAQSFDPCPLESYPNADDRLRCQQTATAQVATSTPYPTHSPTTSPPTNTPVPPSNPGPIPGNSPTPTVTPIMTMTAPPTVVNATPTATSAVIIAPPSSNGTSPNGTSLPTPTSTLVGLETMLCQPGSDVIIEGLARPNTALLLFFNERPVGGTLSQMNGRYLAPMRIGRERPGLYLVEVRERDGLTLVRQLACAVPGSTPTPTPLFAR